MRKCSGRPLLRVALPLAFIVAWQLSVGTAGARSLFPTPVGVVGAFVELATSGALWNAILISVQRIAIGFAIATVLGTTLGVLLASLKPFERLVDPIVETLRPMAPIAWIPLAIFWFGATSKSAIFIVAYAAFFPIVTNVAAGVRHVDLIYREAARTLGAGRPMVLREVMLPGALPLLMVGIRLGLGTAWAAIIAAELTVGSRSGPGNIGGLGQAMYLFFLYESRVEPIIVLMLVIGAIAFLIDGGLRLVERRLTPWVGR